MTVASLVYIIVKMKIFSASESAVKFASVIGFEINKVSHQIGIYLADRQIILVTFTLAHSLATKALLVPLVVA